MPAAVMLRRAAGALVLVAAVGSAAVATTGPTAGPTDTPDPPATVQPSVPVTDARTVSPTQAPLPVPTEDVPAPVRPTTESPTPTLTAAATSEATSETSTDTTVEPPTRPVVVPATPAVVRSSIPLPSVVLALLVLLGGGLLVRAVLRRPTSADHSAGDALGATAAVAGAAAGTAAGVADADVTASRALPPATSSPTAADVGDPATLDFLLAVGVALVDAGDGINHVIEVLEEIAHVNGVHGAGIVVLPTVLIVSLPQGGGVQTDVATPGAQPLRLDQVEEVFRVVDAARRGRISPSDGRVALARIRADRPPFPPVQQLLGYVLFTLGLVLILRGGWLELVVGAGLGAGVGALHLVAERLSRAYQPFLPLVAASGAAAVVLTVARAVPELAVFPPLVACLVAFLPGALLTTAVVELSTGQILSGSARLAAGALRLVLLALGILAGAQLVGVPGSSIDEGAAGLGAAGTWLGVAVFGVGVVLFRGARWTSLRWVLLVLYVAYAAQVVGGLFLGSSLSAFVGAVVMTPVAMVAARQPTGPPALVSFLPAFWLLVPGAAGLQGVTRFLDDDISAGVASLVTMGTSMVGIALGVLLGLTLGAEVLGRLSPTGRDPGAPGQPAAGGPTAGGPGT